MQYEIELQLSCAQALTACREEDVKPTLTNNYLSTTVKKRNTKSFKDSSLSPRKHLSGDLKWARQQCWSILVQAEEAAMWKLCGRQLEQGTRVGQSSWGRGQGRVVGVPVEVGRGSAAGPMGPTTESRLCSEKREVTEGSWAEKWCDLICMLTFLLAFLAAIGEYWRRTQE